VWIRISLAVTCGGAGGCFKRDADSTGLLVEAVLDVSRKAPLEARGTAVFVSTSL
jgi:hypothetical protein